MSRRLGPILPPSLFFVENAVSAIFDMLQKQTLLSQSSQPESLPLLPTNPKIVHTLQPRQHAHSLPDEQPRIDLPRRRDDLDRLQRWNPGVEDREDPERAKTKRVSLDPNASRASVLLTDSESHNPRQADQLFHQPEVSFQPSVSLAPPSHNS